MRKTIWLLVAGAVALALVLGVPYNRGPSEEEKQVFSAFHQKISDSSRSNVDERKKTDLQLALAVAMSAGETGLKQARDCYK